MDKASIIRFAVLWLREYEATALSHSLQGQIEHLERIGKSTTRLDRQLLVQERKQRKAIELIEQGAIDGRFTVDAPYLARDELGDIGGYVSDCYHCVYEDKDCK